MPAIPSRSSGFSISTARLVRDLARRYRLTAQSLVLDVGLGQETVAAFRTLGIPAFGLYDGAAPPRNPELAIAPLEQIPQFQPAVLHQSVPFRVQSFDCVILRGSQAYTGDLTSPEACTATANLLATLKPGRPLLWLGDHDAAVEQHLGNFPGVARPITLGLGGLAGVIRRLIGQSGQRALQFNISGQAVSRLEWHRLARQAVMRSQCHPAA